MQRNSQNSIGNYLGPYIRGFWVKQRGVDVQGLGLGLRGMETRVAVGCWIGAQGSLQRQTINLEGEGPPMECVQPDATSCFPFRFEG